MGLAPSRPSEREYQWNDLVKNQIIPMSSQNKREIERYINQRISTIRPYYEREVRELETSKKNIEQMLDRIINTKYDEYSKDYDQETCNEPSHRNYLINEIKKKFNNYLENDEKINKWKERNILSPEQIDEEFVVKVDVCTNPFNYGKKWDKEIRELENIAQVGGLSDNLKKEFEDLYKNYYVTVSEISLNRRIVNMLNRGDYDHEITRLVKDEISQYCSLADEQRGGSYKQKYIKYKYKYLNY